MEWMVPLKLFEEGGVLMIIVITIMAILKVFQASSSQPLDQLFRLEQVKKSVSKIYFVS